MLIFVIVSVLCGIGMSRCASSTSSSSKFFALNVCQFSFPVERRLRCAGGLAHGCVDYISAKLVAGFHFLLILDGCSFLSPSISLMAEPQVLRSQHAYLISVHLEGLLSKLDSASSTVADPRL